MSSPRGAAALAAAAVLARVALASMGWGETLSARLELASPADSVLRLREGHALVAIGQSPYGGSMLHAPPLVLLLLGPLVADAPVSLTATLPFIAADVLTAFALFGIARVFSSSSCSSSCFSSSDEGEDEDDKTAKKKGAAASKSTASDGDGEGAGDGAFATTPLFVAALYLANPMSVASCVACTTAGMQTAAIVGACYGAVTRKPQLAGAGLATAAYLGGFRHAMLIVPLTLALARGVDREWWMERRRRQRRSPGGGTEEATTATPAAVAGDGDGVGVTTARGPSKGMEDSGTRAGMRRRKGARRVEDGGGAGEEGGRSGEEGLASGGGGAGAGGMGGDGCCGFAVGEAAAHLSAWTVTWGVLLVALSSTAFGHLTTTREWFDATYGFLLSADDLSPNLGIYWYFFTEMFDNFRVFFLFVFHAFAPFLAVLVLIRLVERRPLFCVFLIVLLSGMFHPYPTFGDAARHIAFLPLFGRQLAGSMTTGFLIACGYVFVALLSPIFWQLWTYSRVANANFFFAVTLAYLATQSTLAIGCVAATIEHDRREKLLHCTSTTTRRKMKRKE